MMETNLELLDIYDVWYKPWWHETWFIAGMTLCFILIVGIVSYVFYKKYDTSPLSITVLDRIACDLKKLKNLDVNQQTYFYSQLTMLLKEALQEIYGVSVVHKTDNEFVEFLEQLPALAPEVAVSLKDIFDGVVLIKFAHQKTVKEHMMRSLEKAQEVVKNGTLSKKH